MFVVILLSAGATVTTTNAESFDDAIRVGAEHCGLSHRDAVESVASVRWSGREAYAGGSGEPHGFLFYETDSEAGTSSEASGMVDSEAYFARVRRALEIVKNTCEAPSFEYEDLIGEPEGPENRTSREGWAEVWRRCAPQTPTPESMLLNHACRLRAAMLEGDSWAFAGLLRGCR